jgi:hypothetical protein
VLGFGRVEGRGLEEEEEEYTQGVSDGVGDENEVGKCREKQG